MSRLIHDVIVAGAGPAGLLAAEEVCRRGHDVVVVEEHPVIGVPDHCAGLLSQTGLRRLGLNPPDSVIQNQVMGARIFSPSGHSIYIERGQREAVVVDRRRFDQWLADRAIKRGVHILTENKIVSVRREEDDIVAADVKVSGKISHLKGRVLINAEGSRCRISQQLGFPIVSRRTKLPAYQFEFAGVEMDEDTVEMFYGRKYAPGFFAWMVPLGEGRVRVGLAAHGHAKPRLQALVKHHHILKERLGKGKIERGVGRIILVGRPISRTYADNIMVVGDAAGIVKPTTGGGVIIGGMTAKIAGSTAASAISQGDYSSRSLSKYESQWKSSLMQEFRMMYLAQRTLSSLTDKGLDKVVKGAEDLGLVHVIEREGDMDMQRRVIMRLLSNPRMWALGLNALRYVNPFL